MKKYAVIEIEYDSINELKYVLSEIGNSIASGKKNERRMIANCFVQYESTTRVEPNFTIQEINGKPCMVFKSKMK